MPAESLFGAVQDEHVPDGKRVIRVGLDLTSIASVRGSLEASGVRFLRRVFTARELADCGVRVEGGSSPTPPAVRLLAARFAAKEATFKVLQVRDQAVSWRDVEVVRGACGTLHLLLSGNAANLALAGGIRELGLSLAYERGVAAAIVIASANG